MRAEVVTVGTELLLGEIVDTNSAWLSQRLAVLGVSVDWKTTVGDDLDRMVEAFTLARERADVVIVTGGLGPTQDDITREALAQVTGRPLCRDQGVVGRIEAVFANRGREMAVSNLRQADVPDGARVIPMLWGTAPGLIVPAFPAGGFAGGPAGGPAGGRVFYAMPGVPAEMKEMFERAVAPDLISRMRSSDTIRSRDVNTWGMSESRIADVLAGRIADLATSDVMTIAFRAGIGAVRVRVTVKAQDNELASSLLDAEEVRIRELLGDAVFGTDSDTLESVCVDLLRDAGLKLAAAESMTGGMVGAWITRVPGASDVFLGSAVTYAAEAKSTLLCVPEDILGRDGPVSDSVAAAMATGARRCFGADVGIAVTGLAGPASKGAELQDVEVGCVFLAVDVRGDMSVVQLSFPGDRERVRSFAVATLLDLLRRRLQAVVAS